MPVLDDLKYDDKGLVPCIVQDAATGEVLMFAFANREALEKTLATGKMHYYSRSRGKLWFKGEESGHTQELLELRVDCDMDTLLVKVCQKGGACHLGYRSCFFRKKEGDRWQVNAEKAFDPEEAYRDSR